MRLVVSMVVSSFSLALFRSAVVVVVAEPALLLVMLLKGGRWKWMNEWLSPFGDWSLGDLPT